MSRLLQSSSSRRMPQHLQPPSLYLVTSREVSSLLLTSCRSLDSELEMEQEMDRSVAILNKRDTPDTGHTMTSQVTYYES